MLCVLFGSALAAGRARRARSFATPPAYYTYSREAEYSCKIHVFKEPPKHPHLISMHLRVFLGLPSFPVLIAFLSCTLYQAYHEISRRITHRYLDMIRCDVILCDTADTKTRDTEIVILRDTASSDGHCASCVSGRRSGIKNRHF